MNRIIPINFVAISAMAAAGILVALQAVAGDGFGRAAVMTSGNGSAMSGTFGPNGFHGVYSGRAGAGRFFQPAPIRNPPMGTAVGIGATSGPAAAMAIAAPGGFGVSLGGMPTAGAAAGGNAMAIASPGGVAVGVPDTGLVISDSGVRLLNEAKRAFRIGNHREALQRIDLALTTMGNNGDLAQMRAAVLFAMRDYRSSADAAYRALAISRPWDWKRLRRLYASTDSYREQLRALEKAVAAEPQRADQHLLLGYQYLMLGRSDAARQQIERFSRLVPNDPVATSLLDRLPVEDDAPPVPAADPSLADKRPIGK
jgi:hypothetical protein